MKRLLARILSRLSGHNIEAFTIAGRTVWLIPGAEIAARYPTLEEGVRAVAKLARHEGHHAEQQREEPVAFYFKYAWYTLRYGYWLNPYEVAARRAAGEE